GAWQPVRYVDAVNRHLDFQYEPGPGGPPEVPKVGFLMLEPSSYEEQHTPPRNDDGVATAIFSRPGRYQYRFISRDFPDAREPVLVVSVSPHTPDAPLEVSPATVLAVWKKGQTIPDYDAAEDRRANVCGKPIRFSEYGKTSETGWIVVRTKPKAQ